MTRFIYTLIILVTLGMLLVIEGHAQTNNQMYGPPVHLQWTGFNTNNQYLYWNQYTNGPVLRYTAFWTQFTNSDSGTNWTQTTNWTQFVDASSSQTNAPMWMVPTNVWITLIVIVPGGNHTVPLGPMGYTNQSPLLVSQQEPFPN